MVDISAKYPSSGGSGFYGNQNPPKYITGCYYLPIGYCEKDAGFAMIANQVYYVPYPIYRTKTFAGASIYNTGAGDNGKKIRLMMFADDGAIGGPGTLVKDFGEITLTGAAAIRTLSSSWAATPGIYWCAVWSDTTPTIMPMAPYAFTSGAGWGSGPMNNNFMGAFTIPSGGGYYVGYHYVSSAYGAAPATAVAPTTTFVNATGVTAAVGGGPAFYLKG